MATVSTNNKKKTKKNTVNIYNSVYISHSIKFRYKLSTATTTINKIEKKNEQQKKKRMLVWICGVTRMFLFSTLTQIG